MENSEQWNKEQNDIKDIALVFLLFIVNFQRISNIFLVLVLLFTLSNSMSAGVILLVTALKKVN